MKAIVEIIGGQYAVYSHGNFTVNYTTKRGLIRRINQLRAENEEFWDNWQGYHKPAAYVHIKGEKVLADDDSNCRRATEIAVNCRKPIALNIFDMTANGGFQNEK